jgi:hypothetical protein
MNKTNKTGFEAAYDESFKLACEDLKYKDIELCCKYAGAEICIRSEDSSTIKIKFIDKLVTINIPEFTFTVTAPDTVDIWEKILILHYLANANTDALTGSLITYRQIKSGSVYFPTFEKRSIIPFTKFFAENSESLLEVANHIDAEKYDSGDMAIKIMAFPYVPLYFVLWKADDEFPPSGNILFDETIEKKLSAEDIAVLSQQIVFKLINISKKMISNK